MGRVHGTECEIVAPPETFAVLGRLAQVEDVGFSPSGDRMALVGYGNDSLALVDVRVDPGPDGERVVLGAAVHVTHPLLASPHGVCFLDEWTLVVANRGGDVVLFGISDGPTASAVLARIDLAPGSLTGLAGPSSVLAVPGDDGAIVLLVCNTRGERITRHHLCRAADGTVTVVDNWVALERWLDVPDGATLSPDRRWIAVSNHRHHLVMVYDHAAMLAGVDRPVAVLRGARYPHALQFVDDGRALLATDAGSPDLHRFDVPPGGWRGVVQPSWSRRVIDDATFACARVNSREGGVKGMALHPGGRVLALTARQRPVWFVGLATIAEGARPSDDDVRLGHELALIEENAEWGRIDVVNALALGSNAGPKPRPTNRQRLRWAWKQARGRFV